MRVAYAAVLLVMLTAGCVRATSVTPVPEPPQVVATQPATPPAAKPAAPATPQPGPVKAPAPGAKPPAPATVLAAPGAKPPAAAAAKPPAAAAAKPPAAAAAKPPAVATLDLNSLEERLKGTKAIGLFTKITLRGQVNDLLDRFREYYKGKAKLTMTDLRRSYDLLMMKVLTLLQDEDQPLASAIVSSREAIWGLLANPETFATLEE